MKVTPKVVRTQTIRLEIVGLLQYLERKSEMFTISRFGSSGCDGKKEKHTNCKNTTHQTKQRKNYEPGDGRVKL